MMSLLIEKMITGVIRHKKRCAGIAVSLFLAALAVTVFSSYTNELHHLFPASGETGKSFQVLNKSHLADSVQLEFICTGNGKITDYENYLDQCAAKLAEIPSIRQVTFRYRQKEMTMPDISALITISRDPEILSQCDPAKAVTDAVRQLSLPMCDSKALRKRPFPILENRTVQNLSHLNELGGMKLSPDLPYFANREKNRAMIVFETDIVIGDADAVRRLYHEVDQALSPAPPGISYRIISGCNHTLGNEKVLKRDAAISGIISAVLFLLLFLFFYRRDLRALWIPAIPMIAAIPALGITALFFDEVCLYVIGLGSCIAGLAIDQGIHVYSVCHSPGCKIRNTAELAKPLLLSTGTTILVFVFLAFTGIEAYMQLAVFAGLSLLISSLLALFMLPVLLPDRPVEKSAEKSPAAAKTLPSACRFAASAILILLIIAAVWGVDKLDFDLSAESLDGTPAEILEAEKDFNTAWRDSNAATAMIAVIGKDRDSALQKLENIASELEKNGISVAMPPIPSETRQLEMQKKWHSPETLEKLDDLEKRTRDELEKQNFPVRFFDPFFTAIRSRQNDFPEFLYHIDRKMVKERPESCAAIAMMAETPENIAAAQRMTREIPDAAVISKSSFSDQLKRDFGSRFLTLMLCSIGGALLLALAVFRKVKLLILAALPVVFAFAILTVLSVLFSFRINAASGFALVLLAGLAIDYGVYSVHLLENPEKSSIRRSLILSAATTVAGSGALLFSRHPVLFGTGVVLSCGVAAASFCGICLVPLIAGKPFKKVKSVLFLPLALLLCSCASPGTALEKSEYRDGIQKTAAICPQNGSCKFRANASWSIFGNELSGILIFEIDHDARTAAASGITPAGTRLFLATDKKLELGTGIPENAAYLFRNIRQDLLRIFTIDTAGAVLTGDAENICMKTPDGVKWQFRKNFFTRQLGSFPCRKWNCRYENGFQTVIYHNFDQHYTIRLSGIKTVTGGKK